MTELVRGGGSANPPGTRGPSGPLCVGHHLPRVVALGSLQALGMTGFGVPLDRAGGAHGESRDCPRSGIELRDLLNADGLQKVPARAQTPVLLGGLEVVNMILRNIFF